MKQYDKIYYELDPFFPSLCPRLTTGEKIGMQSGPVIVLTIEELRECFKYGMDSFEDTQTPDQSFNDFLQSKGIAS